MVVEGVVIGQRGVSCSCRGWQEVGMVLQEIRREEGNSAFGTVFQKGWGERVKKLEKKRRSKSYGLKRLRKVGTSQRVESFTETVVGAQEDASKQGGTIEAIDADEDITLVDMEMKVDLAEKQRILDEQMAKRLHDEEVEQVAARAKQEKDDFEKAKVQMEHFKGMTYDQVRPIFEREYNKVQTLFIPDKDVAKPTKKRVIEETLLQESFKKLRAEVEVSDSNSTEDTPIVDPKEMSKEDVKNVQIVSVAEFKVEALQVKHDIFMLTEKDYLLTDVVMLLMLCAKLQVDEDYEMARDLVMKIFMEANKPKSKRSLDTSSK
nr:hypothetical protein [Tanacetum cinerariifolium]